MPTMAPTLNFERKRKTAAPPSNLNKRTRQEQPEDLTLNRSTRSRTCADSLSTTAVNGERLHLGNDEANFQTPEDFLTLALPHQPANSKRLRTLQPTTR
jgi:hypothetical protein